MKHEVFLRIPAEEKALWAHLAKEEGLSLNLWVMLRVRSTIGKREVKEFISPQPIQTEPPAPIAKKYIWPFNCHHTDESLDAACVNNQGLPGFNESAFRKEALLIRNPPPRAYNVEPEGWYKTDEALERMIELNRDWPHFNEAAIKELGADMRASWLNFEASKSERR
jgi:hypothetical protein